MRRICVFCGSKSGDRPTYQASAIELGQALASRGVGLVYGGASIGLMGAVADAVLDAGGEAIGVIPDSLKDKEIAHPGLSDLRVVSNMHARKALMAELADGFIALPGGIGTLEELFEVWTWSNLEIHRKPCVLLNVDGYYDELLAFLTTMSAAGFLRDRGRSLLKSADSVEGAMNAIRQ
ncbi:MAG: TIGR00730 family Rossman fold protein [Gammaproteobacteria bacterium]